MTSILKDSDIIQFDEVEVEDLKITGTINNPTSLEIETPTFIINGGTGDTKLQIKADTDNSGETDNPIIELIQDSGGVNSSIGCGIRSGQSNGNALIINNSIPDSSSLLPTGGIVFKTGRTGDITTTTERMVIDPDGDTNVFGDLNISDNKSIFLGASEDFQLVHDTSNSYIDEQGTGNLFIRSNGNGVFITETSSSNNRMANFETQGRVQLFYNRLLRLETTPGGILIGDAFSHNDTNIAFTTTTAQFILGGTHNTGQPSGSPTVKLLITGTDNDDNPPIDYHCAMVDENGEIDFYAKASYASGNNTAEFQFRGEILNNYRTAIAAGSGFDTATLKSNIRMIDNEIVSTFLIDLDEGPIKSQNGTKIIGEDGSSQAHFTQVQSTLNGYVYKVELCCIETPAGGNTDIDLVFNASTQSTGSTSFTVILNAGAQVRGKCSQALLDGSFDLDFKLLHLANGSGTSTGDYTAGKFLVKLYGANF